MKEILLGLAICIVIIAIGAIVRVLLEGESLYEKKEHTKTEEIIRRVIKEELYLHGRS